MIRTASDDRLTRLASQGSDAAFGEIFERYRAALQRYCRSIVGNDEDAADVLQNTMLRALAALPGDTREIAMLPWLMRVARNEAISLLRTRGRESELEGVAELADPRAASIVDARERVRGLAEDLRLLSEQQRAALLMRELGGLELAEVGDALGITATAARQSIYEARCALTALHEGRSMDCDAVRRALAGGDRRVLRGLRIRGHLRTCAACDAYVARQRRQRGAAAMLWLPLTGPLAWLRQVFASLGPGAVTASSAIAAASAVAVIGAGTSGIDVDAARQASSAPPPRSLGAPDAGRPHTAAPAPVATALALPATARWPVAVRPTRRTGAAPAAARSRRGTPPSPLQHADLPVVTQAVAAAAQGPAVSAAGERSARPRAARRPRPAAAARHPHATPGASSQARTRARTTLPRATGQHARNTPATGGRGATQAAVVRKGGADAAADAGHGSAHAPPPTHPATPAVEPDGPPGHAGDGPGRAGDGAPTPATPARRTQ